MAILNHENYANPPAAWRSVPFWSLNDILDPAEIIRQLKVFKTGGFGGSYLHSRIGLLTPYLGEDWWTAMDAGVEISRELGIEAWFYDEDKWPSGFAGGIVPRESDEYHARSCVRFPTNAPLPKDGVVLHTDNQYTYVCHKFPMGNAWFNGTTWVDLMNPDMVGSFIECTYRPYAERYASDMGDTVKGIFTDEPQVGPHPDGAEGGAGAVGYTPRLPQVFASRNGYDILPVLPSLFEDIGNFRKIRIDYYRTIAFLLEESFSTQIGEYCASTGMVWTGHFNGENAFHTIIPNVGSMMQHYRHMQRPGVDHLGLSIQGGLIAMRSLSSVANQYGLERRLSELFGISGQNMNFQDRKWIGDWHAILGVNHFCPHLSLYSLKGCRKRDYPPTLSPQQPYWDYNTAFEDYMARSCYMTSCGDYAPEALVLFPLETACMHYRPDNESVAEDLTHRFIVFLESLQAGHCNYDLGDEQILADIAKVEGSELVVGNMRYRSVVVPFMETIRRTTLDLLEEFQRNGGNVVVAGESPAFVDGEPGERVAFWNSHPPIAAEDTCLALHKKVPPAVEVDGDGAEHVWIMRRVVEDGQIVQLANVSRKASAQVLVKIDNAGDNPVLWNPADGKCLALAAEDDGRFRISLASSQSYAITTGSASQKARIFGTYTTGPSKTVLKIDQEWSGKRLDPNALTLDFARYAKGNVPLSEPEPVIGIHERLTLQQYAGRLTLVFECMVDTIPPSCELVLEQPELYTIQVNGTPFAFADQGFYRDASFRRTNIVHVLKKGKNTIALGCDYVPAVPDSADPVERYGTEIESLYLIGDFGVTATASGPPMMDTQRNRAGELPARPVHRFSAFTIDGEKTEFKGDLTPQGYPFFAGSFEVRTSFVIESFKADATYSLRFAESEVQVISGSINGTVLDYAAWSPWEIDVTLAVQQGKNELTLVLTNSLRNLLGPHHNRDGELIAVGPVSFEGGGRWPADHEGEDNWYDVRINGSTANWRDEYHCIPFGILAPPELVVREC